MGAMPLSSMFTPSMLAAHLTAALVAGWLLRRGEAALWQAVRLYAVVAEYLAVLGPLTGLLAAFRVLALVTDLIKRRLTALRRNRTWAGAGQHSSLVLQHCVIRRGPPSAAAAA